MQGWAERTPPGFVMHVKAFGLMTRHPVRLEQLPPDLRDGMPVDDRGRVDRPPRELRAVVFREFLDALEPLRAAGKLGGILFQLPPYVVWKPSSLDYLEWAHDQLGGDRMLVEFRHRSWFEEDVRAEMLALARGARDGVRHGRRAAARRAATSRATVVAATAPLAYVRFHGRNAATWNARGGGAAERFDYLYAEDELARVGRAAARARAASPSEAYAFFNNNNQTDGVAQAPAGARCCERLLEERGRAGRLAFDLDRQLGARPLVPRADVVPRVVAERRRICAASAEREPLWQ